MADVFISYAREDRERIQPLVAALEAEGLSVWWDPALVPGRRFREIIAGELAAASAVVVAWSRYSLESDWVHDEAEEGRERGALIPVLLEPVRPPPGFRQVQAADLSQWRGSPRHPEFRALVQAARSLAHATRTAAAEESAPLEADAAPAPQADEATSAAGPDGPPSAPPRDPLRAAPVDGVEAKVLRALASRAGLHVGVDLLLAAVIAVAVLQGDIRGLLWAPVALSPFAAAAAARTMLRRGAPRLALLALAAGFWSVVGAILLMWGVEPRINAASAVGVPMLAAAIGYVVFAVAGGLGLTISGAHRAPQEPA